jgi:hypothetical protein
MLKLQQVGGQKGATYPGHRHLSDTNNKSYLLKPPGSKLLDCRNVICPLINALLYSMMQRMLKQKPSMGGKGAVYLWHKHLSGIKKCSSLLLARTKLLECQMFVCPLIKVYIAMKRM